MTSSAWSALWARSRPRRTRSMPVRAGGSLFGLRRVKIFSLPIGDAVLVDAEFEAPAPFRARADERERTGIVDIDVRGAEHAAYGTGGVRLDQLDFGGRAVGVLGEERAGGADCAEAIAHNCPTARTE